jgi:hypothetical protein
MIISRPKIWILSACTLCLIAALPVSHAESTERQKSLETMGREMGLMSAMVPAVSAFVPFCESGTASSAQIKYFGDQFLNRYVPLIGTSSGIFLDHIEKKAGKPVADATREFIRSSQQTIYSALKQDLAKTDPTDRERICANFLSDLTAGSYSPVKHLQGLLVGLQKLDPDEYQRVLPILRMMIELNEETMAGMKKG